MAGVTQDKWGPGLSSVPIYQRTRPLPEGRQYCRIDGCERTARNYKNAGARVAAKCTYHSRRKKNTGGRKYFRLRKHVVKGGRTVGCMRCGWSAGVCDAHRIIPGTEGGKYVPDNVVALCPHCHRLVTHGVIGDHSAVLKDGEAPVVPLW